MYKSFFEHSPLLALPLFALVLFIVVYATILARTLKKKPSEFDAAARLALSEDKETV